MEHPLEVQVKQLDEQGAQLLFMSKYKPYPHSRHFDGSPLAHFLQLTTH